MMAEYNIGKSGLELTSDYKSPIGQDTMFPIYRLLEHFYILSNALLSHGMKYAGHEKILDQDRVIHL